MWVLLQVSEIRGIPGCGAVWMSSRDGQEQILWVDTIIWFLCDNWLGHGHYVYRNASGKTLVDVIRSLQKYLECVWWVCLCYILSGGGDVFLLASVDHEAAGCKEKLSGKEVDTRNIFYSSEYERQQLKSTLTGILFVTNQKEKMNSARNYCRFLKVNSSSANRHIWETWSLKKCLVEMFCIWSQEWAMFLALIYYPHIG